MKNSSWWQLCIELDPFSHEINEFLGLELSANSTTNKHQTAGISLHCINDASASDSYNNIKGQAFIYVPAVNPLCPPCVFCLSVCDCVCVIMGGSILPRYMTSVIFIHVANKREALERLQGHAYRN